MWNNQLNLGLLFAWGFVIHLMIIVSNIIS